MQNPCDGLRGPDYRPEQRAQLYPGSGGQDRQRDRPGQKSYLFTDKQLLAMPVRSITTSTSWTPQRKFEGISVADILERVGAKGETLTFYALNDYYIDVPLSDVKKYNMILAYRMDGEMLKLRNFGPLFLVYPRDAAGPELNSPLYNSRFIWQVDRIVIK